MIVSNSEMCKCSAILSVERKQIQCAEQVVFRNLSSSSFLSPIFVMNVVPPGRCLVKEYAVVMCTRCMFLQAKQREMSAVT